MTESNDGKWLNELVLPYAKLGVREWAKQNSEVRRRAERLRVEIADISNVQNAVMSPFKADGQSELALIPMPCSPRSVSCAFFAPIRASATGLSFDLVVLNNGGQIAFRFEPRDTLPTTTHGYEHVQLSKSIGHRTRSLPQSPDWLPDSYPCFPIRGDCVASRFLTMAIAMHGYPIGIDNVLQQIFQNRPKQAKDYLGFIRHLLNGESDV